MVEHVEKILIVEDEQDNREVMRAVVEELMGYQALLVEDGATALEIIRREQPALVLMDLMMPVMDGFETISILKADARTAQIPVIAISALGRPMDRRAALDCGADDYISKPFDLDALMNMMERLLERSAEGS